MKTRTGGGCQSVAGLCRRGHGDQEPAAVIATGRADAIVRLVAHFLRNDNVRLGHGQVDAAAEFRRVARRRRAERVGFFLVRQRVHEHAVEGRCKDVAARRRMLVRR